MDRGLLRRSAHALALVHSRYQPEAISFIITKVEMAKDTIGVTDTGPIS